MTRNRRRVKPKVTDIGTRHENFPSSGSGIPPRPRRDSHQKRKEKKKGRWKEGRTLDSYQDVRPKDHRIIILYSGDRGVVGSSRNFVSSTRDGFHYREALKVPVEEGVETSSVLTHRELTSERVCDAEGRRPSCPYPYLTPGTSVSRKRKKGEPTFTESSLTDNSQQSHTPPPVPPPLG